MYNSKIPFNKYVLFWLIICALLVLAMVIIGGYTRLAGAGLSIVEWKPVVGTIPPFNEEQWLLEFAKYKESPEFIKINHSFSLQEFKQIFYIEFFHRFIGRLTGVVFLMPFLYFCILRQISKPLIIKMIAIGILGFLQGFLGWYMVKSGLVNNPHVSHYRLAAHLLCALFIYLLLFWEILTYAGYKKLPSPLRHMNFILFGLLTTIILQIGLGAFVAGLKGGLIYNSFPLMNNQLIPSEIYHLGWLEFSNPAISQFYHRLFALLNLLAISCLTYYFYKQKIAGYVLKTAICLLLVFLLQTSIGVITLINKVPLDFALLHQFMAFVTASFMVLLIYPFVGIPNVK